MGYPIELEEAVVHERGGSRYFILGRARYEHLLLFLLDLAMGSQSCCARHASSGLRPRPRPPAEAAPAPTRLGVNARINLKPPHSV